MDEEDEGVDRRFGVVLFDSPDDPGGPAWVAIAGQRQAQRISGMHQLASDTIWLSNVPYGTFFKLGGSEIWRNPWLRHDKYLVVSPQDILKEWGYDPQLAQATFVAQFVADVFSRIMRIAYNLVRSTDPKVRMGKLFEGKTLRDDLRRLIPDAEYPQGEAAAMMKSGQAFTEFTSVTGPVPRNSKWVRLRKPRVSYCWEMLQVPFPEGPWEHIPRRELNRMAPDERLKWIDGDRQPLMAEVTLASMQQEVAPIYGFGAATDKDKRVQRSWVAHPELPMLRRFAEVDVKSVWRGGGLKPLVPELPEAVVKFLSEKYTDLSWSAGIVAETLWRAAALPEDKSKAGTRSVGTERPDTSWRGAWIKAADKASLFLTALKLTEAGFAVRSYGLGWVLCAVAEEDLATLVKDAAANGLMPTFVDVPDGLFKANTMPDWGGEPRAGVMAQGIQSKQRNWLWNLDAIAALPEDKRRDRLESVWKAKMAGKWG